LFVSLSKAFDAFSRRPFNFVWGSLLFLLFIAVVLLASLGIFMIYFMIASAFNIQMQMDSIPTLIALGIVALVFLFLADGLNGSLAMTYKRALSREKVSLMSFYTYAVRVAPKMFLITSIRDLVWLLLAAPFILVYVYVLNGAAYMDIVIGAIVLFITFVVHALFTPALISAGAGNSGVYGAMQQGFNVLRKRHINLIGAYAMFSIAWVLNFIPLLNLFSLFFLYPVAYSALVMMCEGTGALRNQQQMDED